MVDKKTLESWYGKLTPEQVRKYQRYKNLWGIGEVTAYKAAKGDEFALRLIKGRKISPRYKRHHLTKSRKLHRWKRIPWAVYGTKPQAEKELIELKEFGHKLEIRPIQEFPFKYAIYIWEG